MAPPFWIHCNHCSVVFAIDVTMFMLSCSHTLCKSCMKFTDRGKKCPICKKPFKYELMTKLPDKMKAYFSSNISFSDQLKKIEFQHNHQKHFFGLVRSQKLKFKKASQMKAQLEQEAQKIQVEYEKMVEHRKLMQAKLKEIYLKNQKKGENVYRNPANITQSTVPSTASRPSNISTPTIGYRPNFSSSGDSGFFNNNAPMMQKPNVVPKSFVSGHSGVPESSQSNRKPFFA